MGRQSELAGMERPINKKISNVMQVLSDKTKAHTRASNARKEAETRAIAVMEEEGVEQFVDEDLGLCIDLSDKKHVKLSAWNPPSEKKSKGEDA